MTITQTYTKVIWICFLLYEINFSCFSLFFLYIISSQKFGKAIKHKEICIVIVPNVFKIAIIHKVYKVKILAN